MSAPNLKPRDSAFFDKSSFLSSNHYVYEEYTIPGTRRKLLVRGLSTKAWSIIEQNIQKAAKLEKQNDLESKRMAEQINRSVRIQMILDGVVDPDTKKSWFSEQDIKDLNEIPAEITLGIAKKIEDLTGISKSAKRQVVENLEIAPSAVK